MLQAPLIPSLPVIGVTMRLLPQTSTGDTHDALSQDWGRFLAAAGIAWVPLPNRGEETLAMVQAMGLRGFILSGGGDAGKEPLRDATEALLLQYAMRQNLPVLGVCRGFQSIQLQLKGELHPVEGHVATMHKLWSFTDTFPQPCREVNSFHTQGITKVAPLLTPLAFSRNATGERHVEAAWAPYLMGIMWHPERSLVPNKKDIALLRNFLLFPHKLPLISSSSLVSCANIL